MTAIWFNEIVINSSGDICLRSYRLYQWRGWSETDTPQRNSQSSCMERDPSGRAL
jgi:hypothetical protein